MGINTMECPRCGRSYFEGAEHRCRMSERARGAWLEARTRKEPPTLDLRQVAHLEGWIRE